MEVRELTVGWIGDGRSMATARRPDTNGLDFEVAEDCAKSADKTCVRVRVKGEKAELDALEEKNAK